MLLDQLIGVAAHREIHRIGITAGPDAFAPVRMRRRKHPFGGIGHRPHPRRAFPLTTRIDLPDTGNQSGSCRPDVPRRTTGITSDLIDLGRPRRIRCVVIQAGPSIYTGHASGTFLWI
ncbi:hypothetical protein [Nocardia wallacei]|uniref:hypothetical protein n=1 Tax=Nocardia wallacei TaxID=480035 RepID=UPI0016569FCB|nr:hypothetical protein [Nocardia wallacei]